MSNSNLFKSNFVTFSSDSKLIKVDISDNRIVNKPNEQEPTDDTEEIIDKELDALLQQRDMMRKKTEEQIIKEANKEAERIIAEAKTQADKLKALAFEEGKNEGISEGYQVGATQAEGIITQAEEQLKVNQKKYEEIKKVLSVEYTEVTIAIIEKLTSVLLEDKKEIIMYLIEMGLNEAGMQSKFYNLNVSEGDYAFVLENMQYLRSFVSLNSKLDIQIDSQLKRGDCIIETQSGMINCSLGEQLKGISEDLRLLATQ